MPKWNGWHGLALAHLVRMDGELVIPRPFIGTGISNAERCVGIRVNGVCYRVLLVPRTACIGIRSNSTRKRILCKGSSDRTNAHKHGYKLIDSMFVYHGRTKKTTLEAWERVYVWGRAQPDPTHIPVILSQLTFFQWIPII